MAKRRVRLPTEMEGALSAEVAEQRARIAELEAEVDSLWHGAEESEKARLKAEAEVEKLREALRDLVACVDEDDAFSSKTSNALTAARAALASLEGENDGG